MKYIFLVIFFCATVLEAQVIKRPQLQNKNAERDTLVIDKGGKDSVKIFKPTINDYLIYHQFSEKKVFTLPRNSGKIQISLIKRKKVVVRYKLAKIFTG